MQEGDKYMIYKNANSNLVLNINNITSIYCHHDHLVVNGVTVYSDYLDYSNIIKVYNDIVYLME